MGILQVGFSHTAPVPVYTREYHGGCFGGVMEAISPSVLVVEIFPKWTESSFNCECSFAKMFSMEFCCQLHIVEFQTKVM